MLANKLLMQQDEASGDVAEGVSFDGVTDYLSRSTDLVGNVDSKTFTFSCWVYPTTTGDFHMFKCNDLIRFEIVNGDRFRVVGYDSTSSQRLSVTTYPNTGSFLNKWNHVLVSCDMSNTSKRHIYVNDELITSNWSDYENFSLYFTAMNKFINANYDTNQKHKGRLSNLFLDYTYRDLSIEANRRLFITADGKPADGLASLNPILYLPMKDKATAHINLGTGGDFVQNGLIETADVGANQMQCKASEFDGVDDVLTSSNHYTGANKITLSFIVAPKSTTVNVLTKAQSVSPFNTPVTLKADMNQKILLIFRDSANTIIARVQSSFTVPENRATICSLSFDLSDVNKRCLIIDGEIDTSAAWLNYSDGVIDLSNTATNWSLGSNGATTFAKMDVGELYFDTNYIDLATNNPFWDSETNKPIPVRKAMESLGSNPLICMPIDASNPTKNYGSGGDFTLNGGGLVGARGASEYIARSAGNIDGGLNTARYLNATLSGITSGFSGFICVKRNTTSASTETLLALGGTSGFGLYTDTTEDLKMRLNGSTSTIYTDLFTNTDWHTIFFYKPNNTTNSYYFVVDGVQSTEVVLYSELNLSLQNYIMYDGVSSNKWNGYVANLYFTIDHIDFSQESNRNLFVNQLGYPRDLTPEIEAGNIPTPLIYLPFDDPDNLGKNLGTGGDFTVNGTVTAGADFSL